MDVWSYFDAAAKAGQWITPLVFPDGVVHYRSPRDVPPTSGTAWDAMSGPVQKLVAAVATTAALGVGTACVPADTSRTLPPAPLRAAVANARVAVADVRPSLAHLMTVLSQMIEHFQFLKGVSTGDRALISKTTAKEALVAWLAAWNASGQTLPVPAAATGPDGVMFYSWDRGRHHLELEIVHGRPAEWFYRDRETDTYWAEEYAVGGPLPDAVVETLKLFR